ncbi:MAG TPA: hypothetical protein VK886_19105 [Vicinamibacterales bacterium]|nr:hypothetical protein [Vicinamibacterales bacterium]
MRTTTATAIALAALPLAVLAQGPAKGQPGRQPGLPDTLAIIVHRSNPVVQLTLIELRRIFMLEKQTWPHGRKITVVLREKGQRERTDAIRLICGIDEAEYDRYILLQTFRGQIGQGPRSILTGTGMLRFVFNAPGAIGSVSADQLDGSTKVLQIDGRLPGDPRYPLRLGARRPENGVK